MVRSQAEGALEAAPEQLFRHRFLVSKDLLIRVPLEGPTLLRTFVTYEQLCGVLQARARPPSGRRCRRTHCRTGRHCPKLHRRAPARARTPPAPAERRVLRGPVWRHR
eukprot:7253716-Prymnesium_polylepis.1